MKVNINGHWATVAGMRGKSAYEQAVDAGFKGSKEEFAKGLSNIVEIPSKKGEAENSYVEGGYNGEISVENINLSSRENSLTDFTYDAKENTLNVAIVEYVISNRIPVTTLIPEYDGEEEVINIVGFKTVTCEAFNSADNTLRFSGPLSNSDFTDIPFSFWMASEGLSESKATGIGSHAENASTASGIFSHSEGSGSIAYGNYSHAEGQGVKAYGHASHAEGYRTVTSSAAAYSHVEGHVTLAEGAHAHAEGQYTVASGIDSHAENYHTTASGDYSHAEGKQTTANGDYSHAEGLGTQTTNEAEHACGKYNSSTTGQTIFSIGIGTSNSDRKNAVEVKSDGTIIISDELYVGNIAPNNKIVKYEEITKINDAIKGGVHFLGISTTEITEGSNERPTIEGWDYNTDPLSNGDIVIYGSKEFIWDGNKWYELGDTTEEAQRLSNLESTVTNNINNISTLSEQVKSLEGGTALNTVILQGTATNSAILRSVGASAEGDNSVALGYESTAKGIGSHTVGAHSTSVSDISYTEGMQTTAGRISNIINIETGEIDTSKAMAQIDVIVDLLNKAKDDGLITYDGEFNTVTAITFITNNSSDVIKLIGYASHAEGIETYALGSASHAEGDGTQALSNAAHAEGKNTIAFGSESHAEGESTQANGNQSHAEGLNTIATGHNSHAEGEQTQSEGNNSHAEGYYTKSSGLYSHAEGYNTTAAGNNSHAEGYGTNATSSNAHAEGNQTKANGAASHAEGRETTAGGNASHTEGYLTTTSGTYSHAEGRETIAGGNASHAEGYNTIADGVASHAEGSNTTASGVYSHASGLGTIAQNSSEFACGQYNQSIKDSTIFSVGVGTENDRKNALRIDNDGKIYILIENTEMCLQELLSKLS